MNSFSDYKPGSATAEYRHYVDNAFEIAQAQKKRVDPMYHEKIDSLLDTYARKLAANMNHSFSYPPVNRIVQSSKAAFTYAGFRICQPS